MNMAAKWSDPEQMAPRPRTDGSFGTVGSGFNFFGEALCELMEGYNTFRESNFGLSTVASLPILTHCILVF